MDIYVSILETTQETTRDSQRLLKHFYMISLIYIYKTNKIFESVNA